MPMPPSDPALHRDPKKFLLECVVSTAKKARNRLIMDRWARIGLHNEDMSQKIPHTQGRPQRSAESWRRMDRYDNAVTVG